MKGLPLNYRRIAYVALRGYTTQNSSEISLAEYLECREIFSKNKRAILAVLNG